MDAPLSTGRDAALTCSVAKGDTPMTIEWTFEGRPVGSDMGVRVLSAGPRTSFLAIQSVGAAHSGVYKAPAIVPFELKEALRLGQDTALTCNVLRGDLPLTITWEVNGGAVDDLRSARVISAGPRMSILTLRSVGGDTGGLYTCTAENAIGRATHSVRLTVKEAPEIVPFDVVAPLSTGEDAALTCRASKGDTPMTLSWTFDGRPVTSEMGVNVISAGARTSFLTIQSVGAANSGEYTCTAANDVGEASQSARLTVKEAPEISPFSMEGPLNTGEDAALTCRVGKGDTPLTLDWAFEGRPVTPDMGVLVIHAGSRISVLTIESVEAAHSGAYTCTAANAVGNVSYTAHLTVKEAPEIVPFSMDAPLSTGRDAALTCSVAKGDTPMTIEWTFEGRPVSSEMGVLVLHAGSRISLKYPVYHDHFISLFLFVICTTIESDLHGSSEAPEIVPFSMDAPLSTGRDAALTCSVAKGDTPMTIEWTFEGRPVAELQKVRVISGGSRTSLLTVSSVDGSHSGLYTCTLHGYERGGHGGPLGAAHRQGSVALPPEIFPFPALDALMDGDDASLTCYAYKGDTPMTISWTFHGRDVSMERQFTTQAVGTRTKMLVIPAVSHGHSGTYTCIAKNAAGRAEYSTQLVVKVPPEIFPFPTLDALRDGDDATLQCYVFKGDTPMTITWTFHGRDVSMERQFTTLSAGDRTSILLVKAVSHGHSGTYTCRAKNAAGVTQLSTALVVKGQFLRLWKCASVTKRPPFSSCCSAPPVSAS
ncbi:Titin [Amphibalanus amphitrite]|uniref:Titin n=1 Tax=Amphibalanus amphitrite TaxID=1232801 RepID=A0A6A4VPX7_AMPAM|nr:Titin [Amphibalanus amphitrite]